MLNWAARYYPIVRILKGLGQFDEASLLEIGSGPVGIGKFRKVPFVGCDISFPFEPKWPMTPIVASAAELPFDDNDFDVVLASDVLEHVPPDLRKTVIAESLRVARKFAIFGFPCGKFAWEADQALLEVYLKAKVSPPEWLTEHMDAKFPEIDFLKERNGWSIQHQGNENITFHSWLMRMEMSRAFITISSMCMRIAPRLVEALLRKADRPPFYRQIFVLRKLDI
jgi:SAM-dependent methyltransferase